MRLLLSLCLVFSLSNLLYAQITLNSSCEDQIFCLEDSSCESASIQLGIEAITQCVTSDLSFSYTIDLDNNGSLDFSGTASSVSNDYPVGIHAIDFTVMDNCDSSATCSYLFEVKDCIAPTISIFNGLAIDMPSSQEFDFTATLLDNGSFDNCGIEQFLIHMPALGPGQTAPPVAATSSIPLNCDHLGTQTLDFWVSDNAGNWTYTSTYIVVQNNLNSCPTETFEICINASTECATPIDSVFIEFGLTAIPGLDEYLANNCYDISATPLFGNVNVSKNINPKNGVSTFDALLIAKHILGLEQLGSPYKIIAADVNNSGNISIFDVVLIRQLILDHIDQFPNLPSWRFIPEDYVFENESNPFQSTFPSVININNNSEDIQLNYIGMKVGDVNKSADPGLFTSPSIEDRSKGSLLINEQIFDAEEKIKIDFKLNDLQYLSGLQFELEFDADLLKFEHSTSGVLSDFASENLGLSKAKDGYLKVSWLDLREQVTKVDDEVLFSLYFEAKRPGNLSTALRLINNTLSPEAYDKDLNIIGLSLDIQSPLLNDVPLKTQIVPNPFDNIASFNVEMPASTKGTLVIMAGDGRRIIKKTMDLVQGQNTIPLSAAELPTKGIYIYQLRTLTGAYSTGKLVKQ